MREFVKTSTPNQFWAVFDTGSENNDDETAPEVTRRAIRNTAEKLYTFSA